MPSGPRERRREALRRLVIEEDVSVSQNVVTGVVMRLVDKLDGEVMMGGNPQIYDSLQPSGTCDQLARFLPG